MITVVLAIRQDGRTICLSDTQEVQLVIDYPDEEHREPEIHISDWAPTLVADVLQKAEDVSDD